MALNWHVTNPEMIGGAVVRRPFTTRGITLRGGHQLARDQVLAIPVQNRNAMIASGILDVWPVHGDRFVVPAGKGLFHVVEGKRVTSEPISRDEAEALASGKHA